MACGPWTLRNLQGVWLDPSVGEYGRFINRVSGPVRYDGRRMGVSGTVARDHDLVCSLTLDETPGVQPGCYVELYQLCITIFFVLRCGPLVGLL